MPVDMKTSKRIWNLVSVRRRIEAGVAMVPCFFGKREGGGCCMQAHHLSSSVFFFFNNIICRLEVVSCGEQIYTQMIQIWLLVCGFYDLKVSFDSYVIIW